MPPLFVHVPPPFETLKKKKKRCLIPPGYTLVATYPPPPPPDVDGAPKKKVSESPPPAYQLFWDLREFRGWRRSEKNSMLCPPFLKFLDPPVHGDVLKLHVWEEKKKNSKGKKVRRWQHQLTHLSTVQGMFHTWKIAKIYNFILIFNLIYIHVHVFIQFSLLCLKFFIFKNFYWLNLNLDWSYMYMYICYNVRCGCTFYLNLW